MTRSNLGQTKLRKRRRREDPMREFDRLPPILRVWLANGDTVNHSVVITVRKYCCGH